MNPAYARLAKRCLIAFLVAANAAWCLMFIRAFAEDLKNERKRTRNRLNVTSEAVPGLGGVCSGNSSSASSQSPP